MELNLTFLNIEAQTYFHSRVRNNCFSGGFGNAKTYTACEKAILLLLSFPGYRYAISRQKLTYLRSSTRQTFFKILPPELIKNDDAHITHTTTLINGSLIYWLHLEAWDEKSLRGLEINSSLIDQAEEVEEALYLVLDGRIGRWDGYKVPAALKERHLKELGKPWPTRTLPTGKIVDAVPNYHDILCNPDVETHWIYRTYHPDSSEHEPESTHFYIERETDPNSYDPGTYAQMQNRDQEWVDKYLHGKWGASQSVVHTLRKASVIKVSDFESTEQFNEWLENVLKTSALYRVLDHGESAPTSCLWFAAYKNVHICYREYYVANAPVSAHRSNIHFLSKDETYRGDFADPSIHHKRGQKDGGFWSIALEYLDTEITDAPTISWIGADNNELATRNRINEFLTLFPKAAHPVSLELNSPRLYFIAKSKEYNEGCSHAINEIQAQRKKVIAAEKGKTFYSDEREKGIADHAYDCIRYYVAMHSRGMAGKTRPIPARSFAHYNRLTRMKKAILRHNH